MPYSFVLVHGAWHGGWCWRRVADRLVAKGHRVFAPTLSGLGERSHLLSPAIDLSLHITDVLNVLRWEELQDVVLCGHSYGGMVVTGVADKAAARIRTLVYVDAFVPESGESWLELRRRAFPPGPTIAPTRAEDFRVNERDRPWVDRLCTPQPAATSTEKLALSGAHRGIGRKVYVRAGEFPSSVFDGYYERCRSDPGWTAHRLPCGHDIMVDMPDALAEILESSA
ncbi:MAG TPA: alpha/beta hydrolase [Stellaceae bacterium]|nr:alpha/beta hydrolase [Stellaceae bacterium]